MINGVQLKDKFLKIPIIQGGMGVGISLSSLAGNVMKEGAMGVLSFAQPGYDTKRFIRNSVENNIESMQNEVKKAREISNGKGILGINIMVATTEYARYVKEALKMGVDAIISGAGLPLNLPELAKGSNVMLAPIVSSAKALKLILRRWDSHHKKTPDFIVIEGSEAGGHLGFKKEDVYSNKCEKLEDILEQSLVVLKEYEEKYNTKIPVFMAGGIYTGKDIASFIKLGASGVQMGTRFIATEECDAHDNFKQKFIEAKKEDIRFVNSPTGLPGRAINTKFTERLDKEGRIPPKYCVDCILPCDPKTTIYCITDALIRAVRGDVDNGLVFSGSNGYKINKIVKVKELISELITDAKKEFSFKSVLNNN